MQIRHVYDFKQSCNLATIAMVSMSEFVTVVAVKSAVFWAIPRCIPLEIYRYSTETFLTFYHTTRCHIPGVVGLIFNCNYYSYISYFALTEGNFSTTFFSMDDVQFF
jgi:hypothetical protein